MHKRAGDRIGKAAATHKFGGQNVAQPSFFPTSINVYVSSRLLQPDVWPFPPEFSGKKRELCLRYLLFATCANEPHSPSRCAGRANSPRSASKCPGLGLPIPRIVRRFRSGPDPKPRSGHDNLISYRQELT